MPVRALTGDDALTLAKQTVRGTVCLLAVEYNWGPPVSGRFDTDFLNVWAAVSAGVGAGSLFCRVGALTVSGPSTPFERTVARLGDADYGFFSLALQSQSLFPTDFVLRFESDNGETSYDNNQGGNYHIEPWGGWGISAVRKDEAIFSLGQIVACKLFWAQYPPASVT